MRVSLASRFVISAMLIIVSTATGGYAGEPVSPEIDPGTVVAGLSLLAAGALVLRARRRSK